MRVRIDPLDRPVGGRHERGIGLGLDLDALAERGERDGVGLVAARHRELEGGPELGGRIGRAERLIHLDPPGVSGDHRSAKLVGR